MEALRVWVIRILLTGATLLLLGLNWVYPFGTLGHEVLVQLFFAVMIVIIFLDFKMLIPLTTLYVLGHSIHDAWTHGHVPEVTWIQSAVHLVMAGALYKIVRLRNKEYEDRRIMIESMDLGLVHFIGEKDDQGRIRDVRFLSVNEAFTLLVGKNKDDLKKQPLSEAFKDLPEETFQAFIQVVSEGGSKEITTYIPSLKRHLRLSFYAPRSGEGAVLVRDITQYKRVAQQLEHLSRYDFLTGLYNREHLMNVLKFLTNETNHSLGVVIFDIDNLEILNRTIGAEAGDEAIKLVAKTMQNHADKEDQLFRYGGDEFVLLTTNPNEKSLKKYAREVELDFSSQAVKGISLTVASSIVMKSGTDTDKEMILIEAEKALYSRKVIEMNSTHIQMLRGLLEILTAKFNYEKVHSERVSRLTQRLCEALDLPDTLIEEASVAAMFHDIGKIAIADAILGKPSKLTKEEFENIKEHSAIGHKILQSAAPNNKLADYVLYHHERIDGKGYPEGLKGTEIPLLSRIISVVDAYEAMTSNREYSPPMTKEEAIEEIKANMGTQFDTNIAQVFITHVLKKEKG